MENKYYLDPKVKIEPGFKIGINSIIGEKPLRKIKNYECLIGKYFFAFSNAVIYLGSKIGDKAIIGHNCIIREENIIGENFNLWNNSIIDFGCMIGDNVKIHCNCYIPQFTIIKDNVFIAPGSTFANDSHPGCKHSRDCLEGPIIEKNVKIGVAVIILPGIKIGMNSIIGAGSVVTKDIPPNSLAFGNPAKIVKKVSDIKCKKGLIKNPYIDL